MNGGASSRRLGVYTNGKCRGYPMGIEEQIARARATYQRLRSSKEYQERVAAEESEDNERSNPLGLYNFAESYLHSAQALRGCNVRATHPEDPVRFLYYHALELY